MLKRYPSAICVWWNEFPHWHPLHQKETDAKSFDLLCSLHFHSSASFFFSVWSLWMHANVIHIGGNFNAFILFLFLSRLVLLFFYFFGFADEPKIDFPNENRVYLFVCLFCISPVWMLRKISYILNCGSFCTFVYKIQFNLHANSHIFLCAL